MTSESTIVYGNKLNFRKIKKAGQSPRVTKIHITSVGTCLLGFCGKRFYMYWCFACMHICAYLCSEFRRCQIPWDKSCRCCEPATRMLGIEQPRSSGREARTPSGCTLQPLPIYPINSFPRFCPLLSPVDTIMFITFRHRP